ncbi:30S ribosomal protein S2 [Patescibacteria group bacterium]|nr:30S ribosomal protein S2 [Patescibacteria group bacterium]MBU4274811.1 30S ribosomal protein S2 [Patescibacteria group bacterium]MBU4367773.1 30S ribosomal protein S2 [Patescibacteria group bacterium]MBU4461463.1 30S ribosomal protein S2 [Patescibacteria group bacterium]MCG2700405.1 30S ribosomal protein S2 [Candidatus Parcubacteria bacterium]
MSKEKFNLNIAEMTQAGVHLGHAVSKLHPNMKLYVSGIKNTIHIIDLEKTIDEFSKALTFISNLITEGKNLLIVGTKVPSKSLVKQNAEEMDLSYVNTRWLGGTFTNFETIFKRVGRFIQLEKEKADGSLEKYTKKERMKINKEIETLRVKFEGIKNMQKLPEAILILDMRKDITAAREAKKKGVKIIAVCDTNINPDLVDYIIPANDDAISSVRYILEKVKETVLKAKEEPKKEEKNN